MTKFVTTIFKRLEGVGQQNFKVVYPKQTVKLIQERVFPDSLMTAIEQRLEYSEALKSDLRKYVAPLCDEAVICDKAQRQLKTSRGAGSSRSQSRNRQSVISTSKTKATWTPPTGHQVPLCVDEVHAKKGIRHCMKDCDKVTDPDERKRLIEKKHEQSKKACDQNARMVGKLDKKEALIVRQYRLRIHEA